METQFEMIARALDWIVTHQEEQPGLAELADEFGRSEAHLQRTFQDYAGVSPKQFLKYLTRNQAMSRLGRGETVLDTALDCGLSGPGRLHDLLVTTTAMTPGQARKGGAGVDMQFGVGPSPFGPAMVAWTERGLTFLAFCTGKSAQAAKEELQAQWPDARLNSDNGAAAQWLELIFEDSQTEPIKVWLRGSPFQLQVWEALLAIPSAAHCTYGQIAGHLNKPLASRAVGTAIGRNPISWLIPCHRVITSSGTAGGYRWGIDTKMAMIGIEAAGFDQERNAA